MRRCVLLAFATLAMAADLPKSVGYVNDFAGQLSLSERQALENRLREYERATTNEVAVAIVESLDGESVDAYANRLFNSWGIGKKERNNGVLLLWAPAERKVRIEVGMGLEGAIPNTAAAEIVRTVTTLFRQQEYVRGLNAGWMRSWRGWTPTVRATAARLCPQRRFHWNPRSIGVGRSPWRPPWRGWPGSSW